LRDELAAHQLELVQREVQWKEATELSKKLQLENQQLVERYMILKQEQMSKINEANEHVET
jgi:autophagy-related protein 16